MRLLLVEDDRMIGDSLRQALRDEGYAVDWVYDAQAAAATLASERFDLVLLDIGLPRGNGLDVLRELRQRKDTTPVIVLTARDALGERVAGLDAGADDYLAKPFDLDELSARLRALVRRVHEGARALPIGAGSLDLELREAVRADGDRVALSSREFELLRVLADRPRAVHSRDELRRVVFDRSVAASIVDTYVYYLRRKLGRGAVLTVHGLGYRLGEL